MIDSRSIDILECFIEGSGELVGGIVMCIADRGVTNLREVLIQISMVYPKVVFNFKPYH